MKEISKQCRVLAKVKNVVVTFLLRHIMLGLELLVIAQFSHILYFADNLFGIVNNIWNCSDLLALNHSEDLFRILLQIQSFQSKGLVRYTSCHVSHPVRKVGRQ